MYVIDTENVHQVLPEGCRLIRDHHQVSDSRNGKVWVLDAPLTTVYRRPKERVLFWAARDANPFFHLMECLWMMSGRRDVAWISQFSSNIANYSDDGELFNGAYGHRWRHFFGVDQLSKIIANLRTTPTCRRQVLAMWSAHDLLNQKTKDVPCNTQAMFQIDPSGKLNMMITNRSNDMIWGAYGANAVHFSFLLEVMASFIDVPVGNYTQVSMNTHVYERHFSLVQDLARIAPDVMAGEQPKDSCLYSAGMVSTYPVVKDFRWFSDLELFMSDATRGFSNPFFPEVAIPMRDAYLAWRSKRPDQTPLQILSQCAATDWQKAGKEWLERRAR